MSIKVATQVFWGMLRFDVGWRMASSFVKLRGPKRHPS